MKQVVLYLETDADIFPRVNSQCKGRKQPLTERSLLGTDQVNNIIFTEQSLLKIFRVYMIIVNLLKVL